MAYKIFQCESCSTRIAVDEKVKDRPIACPNCRGMLVLEGVANEFDGERFTCPDCGNFFKYRGEPFKCAFCDHSFSSRGKYF